MGASIRMRGAQPIGKIATPVDLETAPEQTLLPPPAPAEAPVAETQPGPKPVMVDVPTAQRWFAECGIRQRNAIERQRTARGKLAAALAHFQRVTGATVTQEQLIRQHLANETWLRGEVAAGRVSPRQQGQPGPSAIDQFAFHTRRQGRSAGGGSAFRRGAVGINELQRRQAEKVARQRQLDLAKQGQ